MRVLPSSQIVSSPSAPFASGKKSGVSYAKQGAPVSFVALQKLAACAPHFAKCQAHRAERGAPFERRELVCFSRVNDEVIPLSS